MPLILSSGAGALLGAAAIALCLGVAALAVVAAALLVLRCSARRVAEEERKERDRR